MRDRETDKERVELLESDVLGSAVPGGDRELHNPVAVEVPEVMIGVHAGEQAHEPIGKRVKKKPKRKSARVSSLWAEKPVKAREAKKPTGVAKKRSTAVKAPSHEKFVEMFKQRLLDSQELASRQKEGAPRERGGTSVPCRVCAGPTRVLFTRRSGIDRIGAWQRGPVCPGNIGDIYRRRECKNKYCHSPSFGTVESIVAETDQGDD